MNKRTASSRTTVALRHLDPATTITLSESERRRAEALFDRIVATPHQDRATADDAPPRRRRRVLVPVAALAAAVVAVSLALGSGGSAFADWTPTPVPLTPATAAAAATTCRSVLEGADRVHVVLGERRGGWTYVLLDGPDEELVCLMPDDLVGADASDRDFNDRRSNGFFGYRTDDPSTPTPMRDSIVQTDSTGGAVSVPGHLPLTEVKGWFSVVGGYVGEDVVSVTVDPPVGPDVEASLHDGRFAAWWPAGSARGDNPGVSQAATYTVTLRDGTTRRVN